MHFVHTQDIRTQLQDRLELADYLILPVSRITKWSLLLSDFRKQSARSALPSGEVDSALSLTRGISRQANNAIHLDMLEGFSKMEVGELVLLVSPVLKILVNQPLHSLVEVAILCLHYGHMYMYPLD